MSERNRDAVDRLADAFEGTDDSNPNGVAVDDVVNDAPETDPENDEGPP